MSAVAPPSPKKPAIITALTCLAAWTLVALVMIHRNLLFASGDDYSRVVLSMRWAREHYFFVEGYYWLPLPFWYYGLWNQGLGRIADFVHWFIPASTLMMMLASWALMLLTHEINRPRESFSQKARTGAVFAALILALTIPFAWRMTATALAEPVFMAGLSWLALLLARFKRRPTRTKWILILALCAALMWVRYEGWPIAFIAWMMACHASHAGPGPRPRFQWQLIAGFAVLAILPLTLMGIHARYSMDPLYFLKFPRIFAMRMMPEVAGQTTWWRIQYLSSLAWGQGWVILPLFVFGLIDGRRRSELKMHALLVAFVWMSYYQGAISNTFGSNPPGRFCVPSLWLSVPIAARGLMWAVRMRPRWLAWLARTLVAVAIFSQINGADLRNWGGITHTPEMLRLAEHLARSARERNGYAVIADDESIGDNINLFRIYMGLDRVMCESWWRPINLPIKGEFYYFTPRPLKGLEPAKSIAGQYMYVFDQWPIPGSKNDMQHARRPK